MTFFLYDPSHEMKMSYISTHLDRICPVQCCVTVVTYTYGQQSHNIHFISLGGWTYLWTDEKTVNPDRDTVWNYPKYWDR